MKFHIDAGELKHRITILRLSENGEKDEDDKVCTEEKPLYSTRAKVLNVRGKEFNDAYSSGTIYEKTFYIRYKEELTSKDRILYNKKEYDIIYANDIEDSHVYYELKCKVSV